MADSAGNEHADTDDEEFEDSVDHHADRTGAPWTPKGNMESIEGVHEVWVLGENESDAFLQQISITKIMRMPQSALWVKRCPPSLKRFLGMTIQGQFCNSKFGSVQPSLSPYSDIYICIIILARRIRQRALADVSNMYRLSFDENVSTDPVV